MPAIRSWDRFQQETIALYQASPAKTRYSVKFRAADGKLTLKITDDIKTFKHTTDSSITLNRFTALNARLFELQSATSLAPPPPPPTEASATVTAAAAAAADGAEGMDGVEATVGAAPAAAAAAAATSAAGGGKKKKKGKGKK